MKNSTNIRIPKKYENVITKVWSEGEDGYWADLKDCCICDCTECHWVHEDTVKEFLSALKDIEIISAKHQASVFGVDTLEDYIKDLATLTDKDWDNFATMEYEGKNTLGEYLEDLTNVKEKDWYKLYSKDNESKLNEWINQHIK